MGDEIEISDWRYTIAEIPDSETIVISEPLKQKAKTIKKLPRLELYDYNPEVITKFPAITINQESRTQEPITLDRGYSHHYAYSIGVWIENDCPPNVLNDWSTIASRTQEIYNLIYNPVVALKANTTLIEPVGENDTVIRVSDDTGFDIGNEAFICDCVYQTTFKIKNKMGNGIVETCFPLNRDYASGSEVICPLFYGHNINVSSDNGTTEMSNGVLVRYTRITYEYDTLIYHRGSNH